MNDCRKKAETKCPEADPGDVPVRPGQSAQASTARGHSSLPAVSAGRRTEAIPQGWVALPVTTNSWLLDDFLDAPDDPVFEHDFDAVRMLRGFGEDSLDDSLCELSAALMLLFHHAYFHSGLKLRSSLAIHGFIMSQDPMSGIDKSRTGLFMNDREKAN
jgi:hypothetical protein